MRRLKRIYLASGVALVGLAAVVVALQLASGDEHTLEGSAAVTLDSAGATTEGVEVRGDWTIEVREPDGRLVSQREFQNAFVGAELLSQILSKDHSLGRWAIGLSNSSFPIHHPCVINEFGYRCVVAENNPDNRPNYFPNLTVLRYNNQLHLSGSFIAQHDALIDWVVTFNVTCMGEPNHEECTNTTLTPAMGEIPLSEKLFPAGEPIAVSENQQVFIEVVISFS